MSQQADAVALWLVPAAPWHERFGQLISELAQRFEGTVFEPHITLHVGTLGDTPSVCARLAALAGSCAPLTLTCGQTMHGEEHFKTLFVVFDDRRLQVMHDALLTASGLQGDYDLRPHLSLLYRGGLHVAEREHLAATYRFDRKEVTFDEIVLVRPDTPGGDLFDIGRLDTTQRHRLTGRP